MDELGDEVGARWGGGGLDAEADRFVDGELVAAVDGEAVGAEGDGDAVVGRLQGDVGGAHPAGRAVGPHRHEHREHPGRAGAGDQQDQWCPFGVGVVEAVPDRAVTARGAVDVEAADGGPGDGVRRTRRRVRCRPWSEAVAVDVVGAAPAADAGAGVPGSLLVVPLPHPTNTTTAASATEAAARRLRVAGGVLTGADQHCPVGVVGLGFELVLPVGEPPGSGARRSR